MLALLAAATMAHPLSRMYVSFLRSHDSALRTVGLLSSGEASIPFETAAEGAPPQPRRRQ
jgi:hypothetical protein